VCLLFKLNVHQESSLRCMRFGLPCRAPLDGEASRAVAGARNLQLPRWLGKLQPATLL
jgi:hypothetical protein